MTRRNSVSRWWPVFLVTGILVGCEAISNRLTKWQMLDQKAVESPLQAVGGNGMICAPQEVTRDTRTNCEGRPPRMVDYYAPVFVQQRLNAEQQRYPYPPEFDYIGEAGLRRSQTANLRPKSAANRLSMRSTKAAARRRGHVQITYTAWYPAHPQ